jgi:hypothetical protein
MWRFILAYADFAPGVTDLTTKGKLLTCEPDAIEVFWDVPGEQLVTDVLALYTELNLAQDPCANIWIVKPSQNSKGSGVKCLNNYSDITQSVSKLNARIV